MHLFGQMGRAKNKNIPAYRLDHFAKTSYDVTDQLQAHLNLAKSIITDDMFHASSDRDGTIWWLGFLRYDPCLIFQSEQLRGRS